MEKVYTEKDIDLLREQVRDYLTEKRYLHTLAVEREAAFLGSIYLPDKVLALRAAALLHDITKRDDFEKQLQYCSNFGIMVGELDKLSPKIFHSKTAAALISEDFPQFCSDDIVAGVRWHTTGRAGMSIFEAIVYLADYIEDTRTFPDCVTLRSFFREGLESGEDKLLLLYKTMVKSFDMTVQNLVSEGACVDMDTIGARNYYISLVSSFS